MTVKLPFKITKTQIVCFISLLLNLLGGTNTIQPLVNVPDPVCPPLGEPSAAPELPVLSVPAN